jgi:hypothetical protein
MQLHYSTHRDPEAAGKHPAIGFSASEAEE